MNRMPNTRFAGAVAIAALATALSFSNGARAAAGLDARYPDRVEDLDAREIAMLPRYCVYTQIFRERVPGGNNEAEVQRWYATLGPTFHALHHYCFGLMKTNRALLLTRDRQLKKFYLTSSIDEFDYVIRSASGHRGHFVLLPEIHTKKGENLLRLGQAPAGIAELHRAIELKPDYWPPYAVLSDHYKGAGEAYKAREILRRGLRLSPGVKALKTRMSELERVDGHDAKSR